jgi:hypothetical protein
MRYKDDTHDWIWINDADARKLIDAVSPRWQLAVKMLYHYGMRVSELLSLTSENFRDGQLVLKRLKRGRTTHQVIVPELREDLKKLIASKRKGEKLFQIARINIWRNLQDAANRSGIDRRLAHPHAFRHACGRKWARRGTINEVAAMLGHRTIKTTMIYSALDCDPEMSQKFLGSESCEPVQPRRASAEINVAGQQAGGYQESPEETVHCFHHTGSVSSLYGNCTVPKLFLIRGGTR